MKWISKILIVTILISIFILFLYEQPKREIVLAEKGIVDLQVESSNQITKLSGQWKLWRDGKSRFVDVPHFWEDEGSPYGYGEYELLVKGLEPDKSYGVSIIDEVTAYELWIEDELILSNGHVGMNENSHIPEWNYESGIFRSSAEGEARFIMKLSNFSYYRGGFWNSVEIMEPELLEKIGVEKLIEVFLAASILIMSLFFLGLGMFFDEDIRPILFSIFGFANVVRLLFTGKRVIHDFIPGLPWESAVRIEYLVSYLLLPLLGFFVLSVWHVYRKSLLRRLLYLMIVMGIGLSIFSPHNIYPLYQEPYKYFSLVILCLIIIIVLKNYNDKKTESILFFLGFSTIIIAVMAETFIRGQYSLIPYSGFIITLCFSAVTLKGFLDTLNEKKYYEVVAFNDSLTGLKNRMYLNQYIDNPMKINDSDRMYILFMDLDGFKQVNDVHGHKIGDQVLRIAAERIKNNLKKTDTICRYGGDEFVAFVECSGSNDLQKICDRIIKTVARPIIINRREYYIGISIGVARLSGFNNNIEKAIRAADEAMYNAKKKGGNQLKEFV